MQTFSAEKWEESIFKKFLKGPVGKDQRTGHAEDTTLVSPVSGAISLADIVVLSLRHPQNSGRRHKRFWSASTEGMRPYQRHQSFQSSSLSLSPSSPPTLPSSLLFSFSLSLPLFVCFVFSDRLPLSCPVPRQASHLYCFCLCLWSARLTGICHHAQPCYYHNGG